MSEILVENRGDYYMDVREFKNGGIEVLLKAIRPMHEDAIRSVANRDPNEERNGVNAKAVFALRHVKEETSDFEKTENHQRAVRRAKQKIRWCVRNFEADRLLTLTYRENMQDRERLKADFKRFLRLVKTGWAGQGGMKDWRYIAVVERQERGAYHVHCAIKGWQKITFLRACWLKALGGTGHETGEATPGNVDVTSPKKAKWGTQFREWKSAKLAAYLVKYLAKTFDEATSDKKRYWHSKDIEVPERQRYCFGATDLVSAIQECARVLVLAFGFEIDFSRSWLSPSKDCLWLSLGEC